MPRYLLRGAEALLDHLLGDALLGKATGSVLPRALARPQLPAQPRQPRARRQRLLPQHRAWWPVSRQSAGTLRDERADTSQLQRTILVDTACGGVENCTSIGKVCTRSATGTQEVDSAACCKRGLQESKP